MIPETCRCGYQENSKDHPCHGKGYECKKPATQRFYNPKPMPIGGSNKTIKFIISETWACDECWKDFMK